MSTVLELPLLAALLGGGLCSLLGYYVLRLGIATLAFTVAHAALAGAALSLTLGTDTTVTAMVVATVTAVLLGVVFARLEYGRDLVCMALFSLFNAVALLCIYLSNVQVLATVSLAEVLWGSVLTVTVPKVILLAGVTAAVILYVLAFKPQIDSMVFDKRLAEAEGVPVTLHTLLLLLATALAIAVVLRITGGFLTFTLLYNPVLASLQLTQSGRRQLQLTTALGSGTAVTGVVLSYVLDLPVGISIALTSAVVTAVSALLGYLLRHSE